MIKISDKISIIIPIYNAENFLYDSIGSLVNQTIGQDKIEIIMVDDCSTDKSPQIIDEFDKKYECCKVIHLKENSGYPSKPRNIGLKESSGKYIMFMDNDDVYELDACEKLYKIIEKYDGDIVDSLHKLNINGQIEKSEINHNIPINKVINPLTNKEVFNNITIWGKIFKKSFLEKYEIKYNEELYAEDHIFSVHSYLHNPKFIYSDYYSYVYSMLENSTSTNVTKKGILKTIEGYMHILNLLKKHNHEEIIPIYFNTQLKNLYSFAIRLDKSDKRECFEKFYELNKQANNQINCIEPWAILLNKLIKNNQINLAITYSEIIKKVYNTNIFKNIYRKLYLFK